MADIYLAKRTKRWINAVGIGVWGSGAGWLLAHYLLSTPNEFGTLNHPSEPWWLRIHGAFAFLALWTAGTMWGVHIVKAWAVHRQRWSGGALFRPASDTDRHRLFVVLRGR